ncbi:MAG: anti-sigma factor antagonist [Erysipelotrichaceae bacterium]
MKHNYCEGTLTIMIQGRIDTTSAPALQNELFTLMNEHSPGQLIIDAENLEYISSAGLRVLLKLKKKVPDVQMINVSPGIYEILNVTGFSEILSVKKAMRQISVEGCEVIGKGSFGTTYKLDSDTIVKVYNEGVSFEDMTREKENSKAAFVNGIPTAIPFDTVKVGNLYGNVYELINARMLSKAISDEPDRIDEYAIKAAELLKLMATTHIKSGTFKPFADTSLEFIERADNYFSDKKLFSAKQKELLLKLYNNVPERDTLIHGDFHTRNIFETSNELLLIDMADTGTGHPVFEWGNMYMALVLTARLPDKLFRQLIGLEKKQAEHFFNKVFELSFGSLSREDQNNVKEIIYLFSQLRMITMVTASRVLEQFPLFLQKLILHNMRNGLKKTYFKKPDAVLDTLKKAAELF